MKCVINQFRPLYLDSKTNDIRLGNHPGSGTRIDNAPRQVVEILSLFVEPIDRETAVASLREGLEMSPDEIDSLIQQLLDVGYLIDADVASSQIPADDPLVREGLYFAMQGNYERVSCALNNIRRSHVAILGVGGIGSVVAETLARAGIGGLTLVDDDRVEESNLIRQTLFSHADIGRPKIEAAADALRRIGPNIEVVAASATVGADGSLMELVRAVDMVVSTVDRPTRAARETVNRLCVEAGTPFVLAGFSEHVGVIGPLVVPGETACHQCVLEQIGEVGGQPLNDGREIPSYGPLCLAIGAIASDEVIRHLSGYAPCSLKGASLMLDMGNYATTRQGWHRVPACSICSAGEEKDAL